MIRAALAAIGAAVVLTACPTPPPKPLPPLPPATLNDECLEAATKQILFVFQLTGLGNYRLHFYGSTPPSNDAPRNNVTGVQVWHSWTLPVGLEFEVAPGNWQQVGFASQPPGRFC